MDNYRVLKKKEYKKLNALKIGLTNVSSVTTTIPASVPLTYTDNDGQRYVKLKYAIKLDKKVSYNGTSSTL